MREIETGLDLSSELGYMLGKVLGTQARPANGWPSSYYWAMSK